MNRLPVSLFRYAISLIALCVIGPLSIRVIEIPFTMQTLIIAATAIAFRWPAVLALLTYIGMGLFGLPVWSGFNANPDILTSSSGGFIAGFLAMASFLAVMDQRDETKYGALFALSLMGHGLLLVAAGVVSTLAELDLNFTRTLITSLLISTLVKSLLVPVVVRALQRISK